MSRKTVGTLYAVSCMLELMAAASFLGRGPILTLFCAFAGWVISMIVWIGTLVHFGKIQEWNWFVLTFFFGGILMLIYLLGGGPAQPGPISTPPARSVYKYGLICGFTLAGIMTIFYGLARLFVGLSYSLFPSTPLLFSYGEFVIFQTFLPFLLALPIFFWISKSAAQRTGLPKAGSRVIFHAICWLAGVEFLLLIGGFGGLITVTVQTFYDSSFLSWFFIIRLLSVIAILLLLFGLGALLDRMWAKYVREESPIPAVPQFSQAQVAPVAFAPQAYSAQQPAQAPFVAQASPAQPPVSSLEILRQRYARGEIDTATYEKMYRMLKE